MVIKPVRVVHIAMYLYDVPSTLYQMLQLLDMLNFGKDSLF